MLNKKIKYALRIYDVKAYELAELLGISQSTYFIRMRKELPEEEQDRIVDLIKNFKGE